MTLSRRIVRIAWALFTALAAGILFFLGEEGFALIILILSLSMIVFGARKLIFYFRMAQHMVDGRSILYLGVIALDFGIFSLSISRNEGLVIVLYLLGVHAFSGAVDILRALEVRQFEGASWRLNLAMGCLNIAFAVGAVAFGLLPGNRQLLTDIFALGLLNTAVLNFISAFRRTAIVYIP